VSKKYGIFAPGLNIFIPRKKEGLLPKWFAYTLPLVSFFSFLRLSFVSLGKKI